MADAANFKKIHTMMAEWNNIGRAMEMFDAGKIITSMGIGDESMPDELRVYTIHMETPDTMKESIKDQLNTQRQQLQNELQQHGVTGLDQLLQDENERRAYIVEERRKVEEAAKQVS
jgi:tRNA A37 threonylcarbamoyladenosine dehydratase